MAEKQEPANPDKAMIFSRRESSKNQVERSIYIWFQDHLPDAPSIHTLTIAAQGTLDAECRDRKVERSEVVTDIEKLSDTERRIIRNPQNFFKHGDHDKHGKHKPKTKKDELPFPPGMPDAFIYDNVFTYQRLFGGVSQIMVCFTLRFAFENSGHPAFKNVTDAIMNRFGLKQISELGRREFFRKVLPIVGEFQISLPRMRFVLRVDGRSGHIISITR
jgi:hypothetical protein